MTEPLESPEIPYIPSTKRKHKPSKTPKSYTITSITIRTPPHSYAHLELLSSSSATTSLDALAVRFHLTSALTQFLGLTGSAISVDILKVEGRECWIRVPREDLSPLLAAVGGWVGGNGEGQVGWRVRGSGNWLSSLVGRAGLERIWDD